MKHSIKLFAFVFFFCTNCLVLKAQQKHFIYVQSEDKQPFAIVLDGKVYSSSDYGYVIIPKLTDGDYKFTVSFPMNKFPDQSFACSINKKDAGYMLKSNNDEWALENLQTKKLITTNSNTTAANTNAFGNMLSDVVSDSDLTKKSIPPDNTPGANTIAETTATAGVAAATVNAGLTTESGGQPQKIAESKLDTGTNMVFIDKTENGIDTINVFVPSEPTDLTTTNTTNEESSQQQEPSQQIATDNTQSENPAVIVPPVTTDATSSAGTTPNTEIPTENNNAVATNNSTQDVSNPFYKPEENSNATTATAEPTTQTSTANVSNAVKQDCDKMLSDDELNKLKRKMFVQKSNYEMVQYAVKYVSKKCVTTDQVKSLGDLFSSDDGRYNLYDALYDYVYDYGNYPRLADLILDPYYKKRFAALLR